MSELTDMHAFSDIEAEIEAEREADPTRKKLGVFFWICVGWVALNIVLALTANLLPLPNPDLGNYNGPQNAGPGWGHLLGTDDLYRDIFSRLVYGARVSLVVGFGGALIGLVIGGIPGMISAFRRGRVDTVLNTTSYVVLAFPAIVAVIAIVSFWGHSLWKITLIIGIFGAPLIFRIVRASTLSLSAWSPSVTGPDMFRTSGVIDIFLAESTASASVFCGKLGSFSPKSQ